MKRRAFITLLSGAAAALPFAARAQQAMPVIGFLHSGSSGPNAASSAAFRRGLGELGFAEGRNVTIVPRWADDRFDLLPSLARELVRSNVTLIAVGGGEVAALAAKSATSTLPIVFAIGADPVQQGIVAGLNRPSGNITGATFLSVEIRPKMLELLREILPRARRIAVLGNPHRPAFTTLLDEVVRPAKAAGLDVRVLKAGSETEIEEAFATFNQTRVDGLLILSDPVYTNRRDQIARLLRLHKIPTVSSTRETVFAGGLISYGASIQDAYRQAGAYAGRILKGEKPADLPVMQPTKFELVINLKTAKVIGVEIPPTLLARADEVIE
jgi:putative tryptophan/tyrosine transport system substrate-binding protein